MMNILADEKNFLERVLGADADPVPMAADGSGRRFLRCGERVVVLPDLGNPRGLAEAASFFHIGRHLAEKGCPVPRILAYDPGSGAAVCEHGGDTLLHDLVRAQASWSSSGGAAAVYRRVVRALARMQAEAARGFDPGWCWQEPVYGRETMLEQEAYCFLREFVRGELGLRRDIPGLDADFTRLADLAAAAGPILFMHRDFQSRNILVRPDGSFTFIDFQGGRLGPAAYDLASLLYDPYAMMPAATRQELYALYLDTLAGICDIDPAAFGRGFRLLALLRLMQALGAFARLARAGKEGFRRYMAPALDNLALVLSGAGAGFPALAALVDELREKTRQTPPPGPKGPVYVL